MLSSLLNKEPDPPNAHPPSSPSATASTSNRPALSIHRSPLNSLSPTKRPRSPDHAPPRSHPNTPSRTAIGNLVNSLDEPPRTMSRAGSLAVTPSGDTQDEADAAMAVDEQLEDMDDDERQADDVIEVDDDGEESDDDEDEEDDDEDSDDDDSDSDDVSAAVGARSYEAVVVRKQTDTEDIIALEGPEGADIQLKTEPTEPTGGDGEVKADDAQASEEKPTKKKKKRERSPSSDEDLAPPPPPMSTIRLEVDLPLDATLEWNFLQEAARAGFDIYDANGEPYVVVDDIMMQENGEGAGEIAGDGASDLPEGPTPALTPGGDGFGPPGFGTDDAEAEAARLEAKYADYGKSKKKKKFLKPTKSGRRRPRELYDLTDDFIDDSEVYIDRPTHVARPKKEGFYVHQGPLELMEEEGGASRKPKSVRKGVKTPREARPSLSAALRDKYKPKEGQASQVIYVGSDDEDGPPTVRYRPRSASPAEGDPTGGRIDRTIFKNAPREPKYLPPYDSFPDEVAHSLRSLRRASTKHHWDVNNKGKFPEHLKVPLQRAGEAAFHYDMLCIVDKEQTDTRYEAFREKAFVLALCGMLPYNKLTLGKLVLKLCYAEYWRWLQRCEDEGLSQWKEHLEPHLEQMQEDWEKQKREHQAKQDEQEIVDDAEKGKAEPLKRIPYFSQDQDLKDIFRQLVENTQEMVEINKKMEEWGQPIQGQSSELNMRKILYNKIIKMYPGEFMTSLHLSRQFTNYKRSGQGAAAAAAARKGGEEAGE